MAKFAVGKPQTTKEPTITVDAGLPVGVHRFQLVVVNAAGVKSAPDEVTVQVRSSPLVIDSPLTPIVTPVLVQPRQIRSRGQPS